MIAQLPLASPSTDSARGRFGQYHQTSHAENTGEFRSGTYVEHDTPTSHLVDAKFELGENAATSLHKGDAVIVVGKEHATSWADKEGVKQYGRVIDADSIGVDLSRATAAVTRNAKKE